MMERGCPPGKLALGKQLGADLVVNVLEDDPVTVVNDHTHGHGVDYAIEASGQATAITKRFQANLGFDIGQLPAPLGDQRLDHQSQ